MVYLAGGQLLLAGFGVLLIHGGDPGDLGLLAELCGVQCRESVAAHSLVITHHKAVLRTQRHDGTNDPVKTSTANTNNGTLTSNGQ